MSDVELTVADIWATGISPESYPTEFSREQLASWGVRTAPDLLEVEHGTRVLVAGMVTHRQRPATASGVIFINLEDETGMLNVICSVGLWNRYRRVAAAVRRAAGPRGGGAGRRGDLDRGRPDRRGEPGRRNALAGFPMSRSHGTIGAMSEVFEQASVSLILADFAVADQLGKLQMVGGGLQLIGRDHGDRRLGGVRAGGEPDLPAGAVQRAVRVRGGARGRGRHADRADRGRRRCPARG